jgi:hypothetical protein
VQPKSPKKVFPIEIELHNGLTRIVRVKAVSRDKAEERALKFHPTAKGVKR